MIGGGFGGLSAAALLKRRGVPVRVLEERSWVGGSWRLRYDRLRLNTTRVLSRPPGFPFPRSVGRWPHRDAVVAHLEAFAEREGFDVLLDTTAQRVDRDGAGWRVATSRGEMRADAVIVATGQHLEPVLPGWAGLFRGPVLHSGQYRNAAQFSDRAVLVVGGGESSGDLCLDLAEGGAARVWLSVRRPPAIYRIATLGIPIDWISAATARAPLGVLDAIAWLGRLTLTDLSSRGLPRPARGSYSTLIRSRRSGIIEREGFIRAVREGLVEVVGGVEGVEGHEVVLSGGARVRPDALICATGFRPALVPLVGHLGVLGADGYPLVHGAEEHPRARGLHFVGFRIALGGVMRDMRRQCKRIARKVAAGHIGRR